jgi:hypothetical protein
MYAEARRQQIAKENWAANFVQKIWRQHQLPNVFDWKLLRIAQNAKQNKEGVTLAPITLFI